MEWNQNEKSILYTHLKNIYENQLQFRDSKLL